MATAVGDGVLDEGVVVSMHGRAGQIRLSAYVDVLQQVRLSLDELDGRLRPTRTGKARWGVRHMPDDFGLRDLIAPVSVPKRRDPASLRLSTTTLVAGVSKLSEEPGLPAAFSPALVERLQRVGDRRAEGGIEEVVLEQIGGADARSATIDDVVLANAGASVREVSRAMSSFEGVLDVLNNRKSPRAAVYDARTHRAVTVYYDSAELAVRVRELFGRRVSVAGELSRNQQGQPLSMRLTAIDPLPDLTPSSLASLAGMAPDWLGSRSVEDYLDGARRRDEGVAARSSA